MTTQPTEEGNATLDENLIEGAPEQTDFPEDHDPMIAEMKAAEAEIATAAGTQPPAEAAGTQAPQGKEPPAATAAAPKAPTVMVPKARLDEVLSERDLYRDQVGYLRGLNEAKKAPATEPAPVSATGQPATKPADGVAKVDEVEVAITAAEEKKLALAERYDNGEISSKQWKQEEIAIDKEIRALSDKRLEKLREEARIETQNAVQTNNFEAVKNNVGLQLQAKHPNVAVIDALPPNMRDGVWKDITDQAVQNLAAKGIDAKSNNPQAKLLLIQEKARLTDNLEAFGLKGQAPAPAAVAPTGQPVQPKPSEAALARKAKIDLANSQPPTITDMGAGSNNGEITEADIEKMTEDQVADLLLRAPQAIQRIMGGTQNRG